MASSPLSPSSAYSSISRQAKSLSHAVRILGGPLHLTERAVGYQLLHALRCSQNDRISCLRSAGLKASDLKGCAPGNRAAAIVW